MFAGGGGKVEPEQGGLFFRPGRFVFQPKYWANLFKCVFFFYSFVYFSSPCREDQLAVFFFLIFFIRAFSPLPFSRKLLISFLEEIFLSPCTSKNVPRFQKSN